jgi:hypothetical protein
MSTSSLAVTDADRSFLPSIAPKLLSMLDGEQGPDAVSIAGAIIGKKILSNKTTGAPGTIGWTYFVEPIHSALKPHIVNDIVQVQSEESVLVSSQDLALALRRLSALIAAHPSEKLIARLVSPVLISLWALLGTANAVPEAGSPTGLDAFWVDVPKAILETYFRLSGGRAQLRAIVEHLDDRGGNLWFYARARSASGLHVELRAFSEDIRGHAFLEAVWKEVEGLLNASPTESERAVYERQAEKLLDLLLAKRQDQAATGHVPSLAKRLDQSPIDAI